MPRSAIDLTEHKETIISLFHNNHSADEIATHLSLEHNIVVTARTIQRRLQEWKVSKRVKTKDSSQLRARISVLFYQCCLNDKNMLNVLQKEGYQLGHRALQKIRLDLGLSRRISILNREESDRRLLEIVQEELDKGTIEGYGRGHLYTYFRINGYNVARDRLFAAVRVLDPEGVARRLHDLQRHRGEYIVPGPNYLWSIDGHCKLDFWGIEIYAAVDAYSRKIIWIYVGVSSHTAVSVLRQYLDTLHDENVHPLIIRSDRGVETPLLAAAHHEFVKKHDEDISLSDCYYYGTSTANVRIESWWGQLTGSQLFAWRDYFQRLSKDNLYQRDNLGDRITLLAIYMPILRKEVAQFVDVWNYHKIRKQPHRPNSIAGQPWLLYTHPPPDAKQCGFIPNVELLEQLQAQIMDWDVDEYLPLTTKQWCNAQLKDLGYSTGRVSREEYFPDGTRAHCRAYLQLRELVHQHISSQQEPILAQCEKPKGAWNWKSGIPTMSGIDAEEIDVAGEGPDEMTQFSDMMAEIRSRVDDDEEEI